LYEHYYLPQKLSEAAAIQMNDYLLLSAMIGAPALICFGAYFWFSLHPGSTGMAGRKTVAGDRLDGGPASERGQIPCRAGVVVLLVGFWFDGGLFTLATVSLFWTLLELGCADILRPPEAQKAHQ